MKFYLLTEFALVSMMFVCSLTDVNSLADLPINTEYHSLHWVGGISQQI